MIRNVRIGREQRLHGVAAGLLALAMAVGLWPAAATQATASGHKAVAAKELLFVSDGMRPDLAEKYAAAGIMPNYAKVFAGGVVGDNGMVPQFAANTGAGWSSISTGTWSGTHGTPNNTFHIDSNSIVTATSAFNANLVQAETYGEAAEAAGKKVAILDWTATLPGTKVKGPAIDYRNFYSGRGVVANYAVPGVLPNFVKDFGLVYTDGLQIADATGWTGAPPSFSPAKETSFSFKTNVISGTAALLTWPVYIYDSSDDGQVNYDHVFITKESKDAAQAVADLKMGDWKDVKISLPQNGLLVGTYMKLIDLTPDLSKFRLYYTSLSRIRSNMPDLEQKAAADFPTATASDFAPLEAGIVDAQTYVEQGLKWYDTFSPLYDYVIKTYNPDVVMAGYPVTDEFSHQFMALAMPSYSGPRPVYGADPAVADGYIRQAYAQADTALGHLWSLLGPDTVTFLGADHGFSPAWRSVNVLQVLQDAGLYDPANRATSKAIAYVSGGTANVYINLKGREQGGVVETADYETVRSQIMAAFNGLTDDGTAVTGAVLTKEQTRTIKADGYTINGWHPTRTGDVVVVLVPPYQFDAPTAGTRIANSPFYGQHGYLPDVVDLSKNVNMHAMFGIYGPGIAVGKRIGKPRAIDIAPTAAYALGISPPRYAEGRILTEAFSDGSADLVPIQVLAWGDYHGQLDPVTATVDGLSIPSGGVATIGTYWQEQKAQNPDGTIILSDGDNVGATPPNSSFLNDMPTIQAMNLLGFTASALGNHEFDHGIPRLLEQEAAAKFPFLADNIVDSSGAIPAFAKPYIIVTLKGIRIGIIGVGNPETPNAVNPSLIQGYQWIEPVAPTNRYAKELQAQGIQTIIVVYHQGSAGGGYDHPTGIFADFAQAIDPAVDLIVGGHTRVETMARINGTLVTEANHAIDTTQTTLLIDPKTGDTTFAWGAFRRLYTPAVTPEPALAALVKTANEAIKPTLGGQAGTAAALVDRSRKAESKMGNLVTDAMRATYGVDVALANSGGLRADFNPGPITRGDVFAVLPFGNLVVTGRIKGSDLLAALENGVSNLGGDAGRFVQVSGLRIGYDPAAPVGKRILFAVLSDGRAVDAAGTYTIAVNDFMAVGGDGYVSLKNLIEPISREQLWEVAANYVKSLGTINPQVEGRHIVAQAGQAAPTPPAAATPALATPAAALPTA
ncbi:MAG: 5'-nucleotidase C-terminal domain-containing protein, partial [Chloroflexota bacterium]|nr:5'-nucleotidase C-terminal domain-containing protein [Chloroflexota bacterium]